MAQLTRLSLWGSIALPYSFEQGNGPNDFQFASAQGQALSQVGVVSNQIVISGVAANSAITVIGTTGYGYSLNGAAYVTTAGVVNDGDTLRVRVDSSANYNTGTVVTVTINDVVRSFVVITLRDPNLAVGVAAPITRLHARR